MQVERHKTKYSLFHWGTRADPHGHERACCRTAVADADKAAARPVEVPDVADAGPAA